MTRVLYVVSHVSPRVREFAQRMAAHGHTVTVANTVRCWLPSDKIGRGLFAGTIEAQDNLHYVEFDPVGTRANEFLRIGAATPIVLARLMSMARRSDVVLGYNPTAYSGLPALLAARSARRRFVLDYADLVALYDTEHKARQAIERRVTASADHVLVLSHAWADHLVETIGVPRDRISVISNGIEPSEFTFEDIDVREFRRSIGLGSEDEMVVYSGSTWFQDLPGRGRVDIQGLATVVEAMPRLLEKHPNAKLVVLGPDFDQLPPGVNELRASVITPGSYRTADERHRGVLRSADCLVLPAADCATYRYFDRFKAYEYLVSGTPIVAADTPVLREIYEDGAVFYRPEDGDDLAARLSSVLEGNGVSRDPGDVPDRFHWKSLTERLEGVLERMVPNRAGAPRR